MPAAMAWRAPHSPSTSDMLARRMGEDPSCAVMEEARAWLKR